MSHEVEPSNITVRFNVELIEVTDAEVELIEASLGELIPALLANQEEEG